MDDRRAERSDKRIARYRKDYLTESELDATESRRENRRRVVARGKKRQLVLLIDRDAEIATLAFHPAFSRPDRSSIGRNSRADKGGEAEGRIARATKRDLLSTRSGSLCTCIDRRHR